MTDPTIDPLAALAALGMEPAGPPEPVRGGWDTALWRFATADGRRHALRVFRRPEQAATAARERAALAAAAAAGLPVPAVEASGTWHGLPALVLAWCEGVTVGTALERAPWRLWRLGVAFGRAQAAIHAVPPPEELGEGSPRSRLGDPAADPALAEALLAARPAVGTFLHLDYHPLNVLTDGRRITAVLDWANAGPGDRRADLAWTAVLLQAAPLPPGPLRPLLAVARGLLGRAWRAGYRSRAGALPDLTPFMAWAGTVFLRETEARLGRPQVWATARDVEALRRRVRRWRARAGVRDP